MSPGRQARAAAKTARKTSKTSEKTVWQQITDDPRILSGYIIGGLVFLFCVAAAAIKPPEPLLQVALCLLGGVLGWVIGLVSTPLDKKEGRRFNEFAAAVSAFISGFVVAKLGTIADPLAKKIVAAGGDVLLFRTVLFTICLLLGFLFVFINRLYLQETAARSR